MVSLEAFLRDYRQFNYSVSEIVDQYLAWVNETMYMILSRWNNDLQRNEVFAVKCAKRGNDVYRYRVYKRFKGLSSMADEIVFFNPKERGVKQTRALWITLTYDLKRCLFNEAWRNIGVEFNRFMAFIRKRFGKVTCVRVFESFENGYPHIHCILLFESTWFPVFRDRKGQFRVHSKQVITKGWHSNVDVKAMSSLQGGFSYLKKYLLKGIDVKNADSKTKKTLGLCWAFRKRAFSVSGKFRELLSDLILYLHNSNRKQLQSTLTGEIIQDEKFVVLGFVPADVVRLKREIWFKKLDMQQITSVDEYLT
ncbi:MAG: protein rep [Candidatus Bathyarchaeota archaeon]|nr:protein rep [Candidatus Bathyarchaeota archaeon]